jgi:hypothetical protein
MHLDALEPLLLMLLVAVVEASVQRRSERSVATELHVIGHGRKGCDAVALLRGRLISLQAAPWWWQQLPAGGDAPALQPV